MKIFSIFALLIFLSACTSTQKDPIPYELASLPEEDQPLSWMQSPKDSLVFGSYSLKKGSPWLYGHAQKEQIHGLYLQNEDDPLFSFQMQVSAYPFDNEHATWFKNSFGLKFAQTPCVDAWACFVMSTPQENLEIRLYDANKASILSLDDIPEIQKQDLRVLFSNIYMNF